MKHITKNLLLAKAVLVTGSSGIFAALPVAHDDIIVAKKDGVIDLNYLHLNDTDSDEDTLTIKSVGSPSNGTLTSIGTNHYRYTPNSGYMGKDSFTYTISDGKGGEDTATVSISVNDTVDIKAARDKILANVTEFASPHWPGNIVAWGDTAFSVTNFPNDKEGKVLPLVAAATLGKGRVLALPDPDWLNMEKYGGVKSMGPFYKNSIDWLADDSSKAIKIVVMDNKAKTWLEKESYTNVVYSDAASLSSNLSGAKVLITGWLGRSPLQGTLDAISNFTRNGGGLYICDDVAGWSHNKWDYPINRMVREAGFSFSRAGYSRGTLTVDRGVEHLTVDYIREVLQNMGSKTDDEKKLAADQLKEIVFALSPDDIASARLMAAFNAVVAPIIPSLANPVTDADQKMLLSLECLLYAELAKIKPEIIRANRAALPVSSAAPRVQNATYRISSPAEGHYEKTFFTPFYAPPGEIVTINVPTALTSLRLFARVSHLRKNNKPLKRDYTVMPDQVIDFGLNASQIKVVSPHGGLIQIVVPSKVIWTTGDHELTVSGAVEAPYFKFGTTTNTQWIAGIRDRGTPFGVLDAPAATLIVDADKWLRSLNEPHEVMTEWEFLCSKVREFYNADSGRQLIIQQDYYQAGGFSTYPQSYSRDHNTVDLNLLQMYGSGLTQHEYGHRSAHPNIQFHQFQEAAPNISSIWLRHLRNYSWKFQSTNTRINKHIESKNVNLWNMWNHFDTDMKQTPFKLIAAEFGPTTLKDAVHAISALPNISTSQGKIDAWVKVLSTLTEFNMTKFFEEWQLNVSASVKTELSQYPDWMPIEWSPESMTVVAGTTVIFNDPSLNDYSYDGVLELTGISQSNKSSIVKNANGTYSYTPNRGFTGDDSFTYTVKNKTGNTFTRTVKVKVIPAAKNPKLMIFDRDQIDNGWTTINLGKAYKSMVVIAQPMVKDGSPPLVSRIRNVSGSSFELRLARLDGSTAAVTPTKVRIMVVEEGVYSEAEHGIKMEAAKFVSKVTDKGGSMVGEKRQLSHRGLNHYMKPALFGQVMTSNDAKWAACWFMPPLAHTFVIGKHVGEDPQATRADETIGYVIFDTGSYQIGGTQIYAGRTYGEFHNGFRAVESTPVEYDFTRFPRLDSALVQATDESGWGLTRGNGHDGSITMQMVTTGNKLKAYVTEDTLGDSEVDAGKRDASYLLAHNAGVNYFPVFATDPIGKPNAVETVAYTGQTLAGSATDTDGDSLTYSKVSGPEWLVVASNGSLTGTPGTSDVGVNTFVVQVSDGNGGIATVTLNITVNAASVGSLTFDFSAATVDQSGGGNIINMSEGVAVSGQHVTTIANLNMGITGGTWSDLSVTANAKAALVVAESDILTGKWLHIGVDKWTNDSTHTSTATLNFTTPKSLGSSTVLSLDAYKLGSGGRPGGMYLEGYSSGGQKLFKIAFGNGVSSAGPALRGSIRHYDASDVGTDLATQDAIWNGMQLQNVQLTLDTTSFKINTKDAQGNAVEYPALSYVNAAGGNLAKVVFTAKQNKASWGLDNISLTGSNSGGNNAPVANDSTLSIAENVTVGTSVGTVGATDSDTGDTLSYAISGGNTGGVFAINSSSGAITTAAALDYETTSQYVLTVTVTDNGTPIASDTATITVNVTDVVEHPALTSGDIGSVGVAGNASLNTSTGVYTVNGSGSDIWNASDRFHYYRQKLTGDMEITARVLTQQNTNGWAKAGVMIREDLTAGSRHAMMVMTPSNGSVYQYRALAGGSSSGVKSNDGATAPSWVRLTRVGNQLTGYRSPDGVTWTLVGTRSITMSSNVYVGLAVTSHSNNVLSEATFSNVTIRSLVPRLTRTTVNNVSSSSWTTVNLGQNYNSAVVIATPVYPDSAVAPVVTRIRNVNGSSFEVKLDRVDSLSGDVTMDVSVIVVEEGVYTQATHGVNMEAVKYSSTVTSENNSWVAESRSYQNSYTTPVVVGQVMSANDANWSTFWSQGASRIDPPSASALGVGRHLGEDTNVTRANETIGYIVIEAGNGTISGIKYTAGLGGDTVQGTGNTSTGYSYSLSGLTTASAAAISLAGLDEADGGWAVLYGATPLTSTTLTLAVDEDKIGDTERNHTTEQVGYIVFE